MRTTTVPGYLCLCAAAGLAASSALSDYDKPEHSKSWAVVSGPAPDIRFEVLTKADGVPIEQFYQVLQDHRGFTWFTTRSGLVRYDGYRHIVYPGVPMSQIPPKTAEVPGQLFEDHQGNMWVATNVLTRFDASTGKFLETINPRPGPPRYGRDFITSVHDGPGRSLWLALSSYDSAMLKAADISEPVLYEVQPTTGMSVAHPIPPDITKGKNVAIRAIEEDRSGRLWLSTNIGLIRFDPGAGAFQHYPHTHVDDDVWEEKRFNALVWDRTGHLWVHMPAGLERFDPETGTFDRFVASRFWYMFADPSGRIWLWGEYPGLKVFDPLSPAEASLKTVSMTTPSGQRLDDVVIVTLNSDRMGNVCAYPASGAKPFRYSPAIAQFGRYVPEANNSNTLRSGLVLEITGEADGAVWILDNSALNRLDSKSGKFSWFGGGRDNRNVSHYLVTFIYKDRSNTFWAGTEDGQIGSFDSTSGRYTLLPGVHLNRPISSLFEDSSGRFWLGARLGPMTLIDRRTGAATRMSIKGGYVSFEDRQGNLWFGATPGVNRLDKAGNVRMVPLRQPDASHPAPTVVTAIHEDADGILWLTSSRGLHRLDPRSESVVSYGTREGLPTEDVRCMLPDEEANLWLSTARGISRFDIREKRFYNYDEADGLQSGEFTHFACYRAPDGKLYFGGHSGFNAFFPRAILTRERRPSVVLTSFQINGQDAPIRGLDTLNLKYDQNELYFEFAALNAINPANLRYRFKLDRVEKEWIEVDSEHREARYTELPPGDYAFHAEASRDGRSWSGETAALRIKILYPWWRTWWAESLGLLAFIALLFLIYKVRVRRLQRHERYLAAVVEQRTAELVEARNKAEQAQIQAEEANQAKSAFLAHMSHELRNPLTAILAISNLMQEDDGLSKGETEYAGMIYRSGEHLLTLIDDVLDLAKIESGKQEIILAPVDFVALARDVTELMRGKADTKNLSLTFNETGAGYFYVRADAAKLRQVLINLLGNAVKFTEKGSVNLQVSATAPDQAGHLQLKIEVQDTGIGIELEDQKRIFEPFVQAGRATSQKGTGLGLAISRQFVELMGGSIAVESEPGRGSRFTVEIPAEAVRASEVRKASPERCSFVLEGDYLRFRVLVVDDDPENATAIEQMLRRAGFQVCVARTATAGIAAFKEWMPHFVWMDLRLPDAGGIEVARRIRQLPGGSQVKIAALTASVFASQRDEVLAAGMDDFVRKPYRPDEIFECMARHLGLRYQEVSSAKQ